VRLRHERPRVRGLAFCNKDRRTLFQLLSDDRKRRLRAALGRACIDNFLGAVEKLARKARLRPAGEKIVPDYPDSQMIGDDRGCQSSSPNSSSNSDSSISTGPQTSVALRIAFAEDEHVLVSLSELPG
jgi:hypothetical protein